MPTERSVFADCKPGDWIVTNNKGMYQLHTIRPDGRVTIGSYGQFHPDGTGHIGRISLTARPASPDEVADHLEREAERHRKWQAEQDAEQRLERLRDAAPAMLAACKTVVGIWESVPDANCPPYVVQCREAVALTEPPPIT